MASVDDVERRIRLLNSRLQSTFQVSPAARLERERILKELAQAHSDLRRLQASTVSVVVPRVPSPETPVQRPTPVRPTPVQRPTKPERTDVLEQRTAALTERLDRFQEEIAVTTRKVDDCFSSEAAVTETTPALAETRRRRVESALLEARPERRRFNEAYDRAWRDATAPLPDIDVLVENERRVRDLIDDACDFDEVVERQNKALQSARRCTDVGDNVPQRVRDFVLGRAPFDRFIDRRLYCFTGDEGDDQPGSEDIMAMPPLIKAAVFPPEGAPIGQFGFEVVVKEGRYIGIAAPDTQEERRRRRARNRVLIERVTKKAVETVLQVVRVAQRQANAILEVIRTSTTATILRDIVDRLIETIARLQSWIIERAVSVFGTKWSAAVLPALIGKGTYAANSVIARLGATLLGTSVAKPLFLFTTGLALVAYGRSLRGPPSSAFGADTNMISRRIFYASLASAAYSFLLDAVRLPFNAARLHLSFEQGAQLSPTDDGSPPFGGGGIALFETKEPWPTSPTGYYPVPGTTKVEISEDVFDVERIRNALQPFKPMLDDIEAKVYGPALQTLTAGDIKSLSDATAFIGANVTDDAIMKFVSDPTIRDRFWKNWEGAGDPTVILTSVAISAAVSLFPGGAPFVLMNALGGATLSALTQPFLKTALQAYWGGPLVPVEPDTTIDLTAVATATDSLQSYVQSKPVADVAVGLVTNAIASSVTGGRVPIADADSRQKAIKFLAETGQEFFLDLPQHMRRSLV